MKPMLLLTLSFLLFAFTTNQALAFDDGAVRDTDSRFFSSDSGAFFIGPAKVGPKGGGVTLGKTGNSTCPVTAIQDNSAGINGLPVRFTIVGPSDDFVVSLGNPLDIRFLDKPINCGESFKWVVVDDFPIPFVGIGGAEDHPGKRFLNGTFNFQTYKEGYKLVFCPTSGECKNVGIQKDKHRKRRLILTDKDPFQLVIINAWGPTP